MNQNECEEYDKFVTDFILVLSDIIKAIRLVEIYNNETYELYQPSENGIIDKLKIYLYGEERGN